MLVGGGLGAGGGNLLADRFRRYVANTVDPAGYETPNLKPKSMRHFVDAAILDKPTQAYTASGPAESSGWGQPGFSTMKARYELHRRRLGIHSTDAKNDFWEKQPDGSVSLNPQHPEIGAMTKTLMGDNTRSADWVADPKNHVRDSSFYADPILHVGKINSAQLFQPGASSHPGLDDTMMTPINGGQRINLQPYYDQSKPAPTDPPSSILATIRDRWGMNLKPRDQETLAAAPGKLLKHGPHWLDESSPEDPRDYMSGQPNREVMKSLGARWLAENFLYKKPLWVSQQAEFKYQPKLRPDGSTAQDFYQMTPMTGAGVKYPGY